MTRSGPWYDRVPKKKDREAYLKTVSEGTYLGILRRAALRQFGTGTHESSRLQQGALAEALGTKPQNLRDMEEGHRPAPLSVCRVYCEYMGVPIAILKRVGKQHLTWDGDTPRDVPVSIQPQPDPAQATSASPARSTRASQPEKTPEEKERAVKLREERRLAGGAADYLELKDLKKITGIKLRNQLEWNQVAHLSISPSGVLTIDIFDESPSSTPAQLLRDGFTGVRLALPQVIVYDHDKKRKVTDIHVKLV